MNEDRAARYHRLRRRAMVGGAAASAVWLAALIWTGAAASLRDVVDRWTGALPSAVASGAALIVYVAILAAAYEALSLPFAFYRSFILERKYGLSAEPLPAWGRDHVKAASLGTAFILAAAAIVEGSMRAVGASWWLLSAACLAASGVLLANVAPVLLMPIFYRFRPLDRDALRDRLLSLSTKAGVPVLGAFEWGLGEKTRRANAALVGLGRTRRILVSDTLLEDFSDDEIEVILAHEMAHHIHHDMWTALALDGVQLAAALFAADLLLTVASPVLGYRGTADLAALPLLALALFSTSVLFKPIGNAWSRFTERRADRFALALTRRPGAFISAMKRLGAQNLAEERPSSPVFWFFHTHPTIDERVAAARDFRAA